MKKDGLFEKGRAFEKRTGFLKSIKDQTPNVKIVTNLVGEMSRLAMDGQKPELYNESFGIIRTMNREDAEEIAEECKHTARFNVEEEEQDLYTCEGLVMHDKHKPEWYNENPVVIQARYEQDLKRL